MCLMEELREREERLELERRKVAALEEIVAHLNRIATAFDYPIRTVEQRDRVRY